MKRKTIFIIVISLLLLFVLATEILAANPIKDPGSYNPGSSAVVVGADQLSTKANVIIGAIQIIGTILSVVILGIIGIKYMAGSSEERAEYKKTLMPYVIGAVMLFGITNILQLIVTIMHEFDY